MEKEQIIDVEVEIGERETGGGGTLYKSRKLRWKSMEILRQISQVCKGN